MQMVSNMYNISTTMSIKASYCYITKIPVTKFYYMLSFIERIILFFFYQISWSKIVALAGIIIDQCFPCKYQNVLFNIHFLSMYVISVYFRRHHGCGHRRAV